MNYTESNKLIGKFEDFLQYSDTLIELGSCYGRSIQNALDAGYKRVKSVEAKEEYYLHCKKIFKDNPNVELFLGKSIDCLNQMLSDIDKPCVFWIDSHVSGEASAGYQDWLEKGLESDYHQHTAIQKELKIILPHRNDHILLIDDQNGYHADGQVYMDLILSANPNYKFSYIDEQMGDTFYKNKILVAIP